MKISSEELLHIGDGLTNDLIGALKFGAQAIWYNPEGRPVPESTAGIGEFETISDLSQIRDLLLFD